MKDVRVAVCERQDGFVSYELVTLEKWRARTGAQCGSNTNEESKLYEHLLSHSFHMETLRKLMGKTLTVLDASTSGAQNKAMKDLVRSAFSDAMEDAARWSFDQTSMQNLMAQGDMGTPEPISIEDALGVE